MFSEGKKLIEDANSIYITAHVNPDGDAIGSTYAMYFALKKLGKDVHVIMPAYSDNFSFLPNIDVCEKDIEVESYDLLIAMDSSDYSRIAVSKEKYDRARKVLMIDHHQISNPYGDVRYINPDISSTSELVYDIITYFGIEIDSVMASYIYMGIMTDTGSFNYSNTTAKTHMTVADLLNKGAKSTYICKMLNDTIKEEKLLLLKKTIENMEVYFDSKVRYSYVDYSTINSLGLDEEDAEGMTNYLRMVKGTEVAIYVRGKSDGTCKVSMRSAGNVDVSKLAIMFNGGGHPRAAGYSIKDKNDVEIAKKQLLDAIEAVIK